MSVKDFSEVVAFLNRSISKRGDNSRKASDGSVCCVEFRNVIYNNAKNSPSQHLQSTISTITIGSGCNLVDMVVEYCVQLMHLSEESNFSVHHSLLDLQFTATLDSAMYKPYIFQMPNREKVSLAGTFKEQGIYLFKENRLTESFCKFRRSLQYILSVDLQYSDSVMIDDAYVDEIENLIVNIYNNMALIQLNLKQYENVILISSKSLLIQENVKAFYRRALAHMALSAYDTAESDLMNALKLDPANKAILEKLALVRDKDKNNRERYKATVLKMFSN